MTELALENFKFCFNATDVLSCIIHDRMAEKLAANPDLIDEMIKCNDKRKSNANIRSSMAYMLEWDEILGRGVDAVVSMFRDKSDRGQAMRSTSPYVAIVSEEERQEILRDAIPFMNLFRRSKAACHAGIPSKTP